MTRWAGRLLRPATVACLALALSTCSTPVVELAPADVAAAEAPPVETVTPAEQEWGDHDPPRRLRQPPRRVQDPSAMATPTETAAAAPAEPAAPIEPAAAGEPDPEPAPEEPAVATEVVEAAPTPRPTPPAPPEPAPAVADTADVAEPSRVVIPRIGVDHRMTPVGLHPDRTLVVPDDGQVAGWYTGAPRPGRTGPSVLVGHNSWNGAHGVFWDLHRLAPGDEVEVHHDDGSVVAFEVERIEQYPKDAFPTERVYGNTPRREVRVITCGGVFDRQQRRHLDNIVVYGVRTR